MGFVPVQDMLNRIYNAVTKAIGVEIKAGLPAGANKIGSVDAQLTGRNVEDGSTVAGLSFEIDENGYPVLRIVDGAPFAYNQANDAKNVVERRHKLISHVITQNLATNEIYTLTPPAGKIWTLKLLTFDIDATTGGTSGTHQVFIRYGDNQARLGILRAVQPYNSSILFRYGHFDSATTQTPATSVEQSAIVKDLVIKSTTPLYFVYENGGDGTPGSLALNAYFLEEDEVL